MQTYHKFVVTDKIDRSGPEYQSRYVGLVHLTPVTVGRFQFYSDGTPAGDKAVSDMTMLAEQDYQNLKGIYGLGDIPSQPIIVHVDPTAGGAYHLSCQGTKIWLIPEDAPSLLVAELDECFQALQDKMDCGLGVGEGHSRAMAMVVRPFKVLTGLDGDVQGWWKNGNPTDYLSDGTQSDQDQLSNACNTLGWFYIRSLGYDWPTATKAAALKLSDTYVILTGRTTAFTDMVASLKQIPQPWADNPFGAVPPPPPPPPPPTPTPTPSGPGCLATPFLFIVGIWRTIFG